jgi:predicted ribosome quality control (RQC) complex YloA/Tae2 family protein
MSLNCKEIEAVLKSFPQNGLIKKFYQPDKNSIIINIFDGKNDLFVLLSVLDNYNRICIIPHGINMQKSQMRFSENLNGNLQGAKLAMIYQHELSRIVVLKILHYDRTRYLIARLWGKGGNIILTDENFEIIDVLRRLPKRDEWPGEVFELKPNMINKSDYKVRDEFLTGDINYGIFGYYKKAIDEDILKSKLKNSISLIENELDKLNSHLKSIEEKINDGLEEKYRKYGELLKSNFKEIKKGLKKIEIYDYESDGLITIPLQENLTPAENIERYFNKYKKIKNGRIIWEKEKYVTLDKIKNYETLLAEVKNIDNLFDFNKLEEKLNLIGKKSGNNNSVNNRLPARIFNLSNGYKAYVSKSAKDADRMLSAIANGNDYWFHVRDYPGCHVVVKCIKNAQLPEIIKTEASNLAVFFSKIKNAEYADIHFTLVKYLHKSGNKSGLVFPTQEKNLRIKFDKGIIDRIFADKPAME